MPAYSPLITLCSDGHPEQLTASDRQFVHSLASRPLSAVAQFPVSLQAEEASCVADLARVCVENSDVFLRANCALADCESILSALFSATENLVSQIDSLRISARDFEKSAGVLLTARSRIGDVLSHADTVRDMIDLPNLTAACVRAGLYDDALSLAKKSAEFARSFPDSRLVAVLNEETHHEQNKMFSLLITSLCDEPKLSNISHALSTLRNSGAADDELTLLFLSARLHAFTLKTAALDRSDAAQFITAYIDHFRQAVYDLITQYTAICAGLSAGTQSNGMVESPDMLLTSLAYHLIDRLISTVAHALPLVINTDQNAITPILTRLGYCAASFARVGLDFSEIVCDMLHTVFTNAGLTKVTLLDLELNPTVG